jgi:tRNA(fMet)-specific endonuclease VapC
LTSARDDGHGAGAQPASVAPRGSTCRRILDLDREDARVAGEIGAELARLGSLIGPYDVLIAGQAKALGLTLVTHNTGEFSRVPGLRVEDWSLA